MRHLGTDPRAVGNNISDVLSETSCLEISDHDIPLVPAECFDVLVYPFDCGSYVK